MIIQVKWIQQAEKVVPSQKHQFQKNQRVEVKARKYRKLLHQIKRTRFTSCKRYRRSCKWTNALEEPLSSKDLRKSVAGTQLLKMSHLTSTIRIEKLGASSKSSRISMRLTSFQSKLKEKGTEVSLRYVSYS